MSTRRQCLTLVLGGVAMADLAALSEVEHKLTELAEELRASEARRYEKIEQARDAARRPQPDAQAEVQPGTGGGGPASLAGRAC